MAIGLGTRIGPYEVTALLGEGGMGKVWRAHHLRCALMSSTQSGSATLLQRPRA
jgi:serine/threonine protein kinase